MLIYTVWQEKKLLGIYDNLEQAEKLMEAQKAKYQNLDVNISMNNVNETFEWNWYKNSLEYDRIVERRMMGKGIMHISAELYKDVMSTQDDDSYETIEKAFLFPEGMKIVDSFLKCYFDKEDVLLKVEHKKIPQNKEYKRLPAITLHYEKDAQGNVKLKDWKVKEFL
jgi:hypothetical protein